MSKLHYTDQGFVIPTLCEELTSLRRSAKVFELPKTTKAARLFFLARPHSLHVPPLSVSVNGHILPSVSVIGQVPAFQWYELPVPVEVLRDGQNRVEMWSAGDAMDTWTLALDCTPPEKAHSFVSLDGGKNWSSRQLGHFSRNQGEYLVRIRLDEGEDGTPPAFVAEDFSHPRLAALRAMLPPEAASASTTLQKVRCLSSWVAQSWEYRSSLYASLYAPWDTATILAWGKAKQGQNGQKPIVMCVHYAVAFVTACQALGIYARCAVFTEAINSFNGHFAAEAWLPELGKWVFVDPNLDAMFFKDGQPLSTAEVRALIPDLSPYVSFGPGYQYQIQNPSIIEFMNIYLNGRCMKLRGIWPRADYLSHPELTPPGHGSLAFCETDFVWEPAPGLEMFPHFAGPGYFHAVPGTQSAGA